MSRHWAAAGADAPRMADATPIPRLMATVILRKIRISAAPSTTLYSTGTSDRLAHPSAIELRQHRLALRRIEHPPVDLARRPRAQLRIVEVGRRLPGRCEPARQSAIALVPQQRRNRGDDAPVVGELA